MHKVLIVKTSSLGDVVHGFAALPFLKEKIPDLLIDWVVEEPFKELVESHPFINKVIVVKTKKWRKALFQRKTWNEFFQVIRSLKKSRYDAVFDIQGNIKSAIFTFFSRADDKVGFSYRSCPEWPAAWVTNQRYTPPSNRNIRQDYLFIFQSYFKDFKHRLIKAEPVQLKISSKNTQFVNNFLLKITHRNCLKLLISPGSTWKNKEVRPDALECFLRKVLEDDDVFYIFSWGTNEEKKIAYRLHRAFPNDSLVFDKHELNVFQYLISKVDMLIAMDSLPLHLCGLTKTPSYSFFGPSNHLKYKPVGPHHGSDQGGCPYGKVFEKRCSILRSCKTGLCIRGMTGDHLYESFKKYREQLCSIEEPVQSIQEE